MTWRSPDITEADRALIRALDAVEELERAGHRHDSMFMREWERRGAAKGGRHAERA